MVQIYGHPFAAFYWKALIALYERGVPFEFLMVDPEHPENAEAIGRLAPTGQFPALVDGGRVVIESAAIIEYLDLHHGDAPPMVPADPRAAIEARQMDGVFDDYVMAPLQRMVAAVLREEAKRDPHVEAEVQAALDKSYAWLDRWMAGRQWAANETFGIADCAAAP
jgi:glutathione S-transferase